MASEMKSSSCISSFGADPRPSILSRSSSLLRNIYTGRPRTLSQVASAATSGKNPLPQQIVPPTTSPHSPLGGHGSPSDPLDESSSPASIGLTRNLSERRNTTAVKAHHRSASCSAASRRSMHPAKVQRWAGLTRTVSDWDVLRRDPELWYEDGDCYVHLHARGASRRGPSFCVPFRVLRQKKCGAMLSQCDAQMTSTTGSSSQDLRHMPTSLSNSSQGPSTLQLFIPAPDETSREDSFRCHITTRNFFAFLLGKPLVGEHMGQAFVDLQERLQLFRPEQINNHQDFLDYAENQGYRDLVECTDYALASLFYAEHYKLRDVWIDAFAHCVGMNDSLALSPEYTLNSRLTKALITRAYLEVDLHLGRVSTALGSFLEEDLSPTYLGLTDGTRGHLDRFRGFLHSFYAEKFGYWPPPQGTSFPKALYKSMYYDFKSLYDYLVDTDSTTDISLQRPASGGICVLQNVGNFDTRHNFKAQPHPLPLLPTYVSPSKKLESQKALRQLTLASQHNKTHQLHSMSAALAVATNALDEDVTSSKIVQAYMHFERVYAINQYQREEKISAGDARKVRWLLIYGTLQYLVSALRAPKEVRDHESPDYPLCCFVAEKSTWNADSKASTPVTTPSANVSQAIYDYLSDQPGGSPYAIEPDCQREDYFTPKTGSRRGSVEVPAPLKIAPPLRQASIRSFGPRSLSVRSSRSSRKNSLTLKPTQHCAIIVQGYGDGLNEPTATQPPQDSSRRVSSVCSERSSTSILPDGAGPETSWLRPRTPSVPHSRKSSTAESSEPSRSRTPLLDFTQIDQSVDPTTLTAVGEAPSRSDSTGSTASSIWSEGPSVVSSKSSADGEPHSPYKASTAEHSGLLGGLVSVGCSSTERPRAKSAVIPQSHIHPLLRQPSLRGDFDFSFNDQNHAHTHDAIESSFLQSTIGMAFSAPPSPPMRAAPGSQPTISSLEALSLISEKRPSLRARSITLDSVPEAVLASSKTDQGTDGFPTSQMWEQYKTAITRPKGRSSTCSDATPPPFAKTPHARKVSSSFRFIGKSSTADEGVKKERRLSSLWRR